MVKLRYTGDRTGKLMFPVPKVGRVAIGDEFDIKDEAIALAMVEPLVTRDGSLKTDFVLVGEPEPAPVEEPSDTVEAVPAPEEEEEESAQDDAEGGL